MFESPARPSAAEAPAPRPRTAGKAPAGVYVHFPWCLKKCPYCDFVSFAAERERIDHTGYADAVLRELERRRESFANIRIQSIFFGGGTPSLWAPSELGRVLRGIREMGASEGELEVTVECNPTSLDEERARALVDVGVGRLSIGVQALDPGRLRFLGRLHDASGALGAIEAAVRAGVPRVSADFIYGVATSEGLPSPAEQVAELRRALELGITHVSAYSLTIEPGTQFGELARRGRLPIAPDDAVAETFFAIEELLEAEGFVHYEISNYARPGDEAQHNLGYWRGDDYLGLGCAAFGTLSSADGSARRYRNLPDPARYMKAALAGEGQMPVESEEELDAETRLRERIMLGLRLLEGFDLEQAAASLGLEAWTKERAQAAERLVAAARLEVDGGWIRVPKAARVYTDGIAAALF